MKTYSLHEVESMFKVRHDKLKLLCEYFSLGAWKANRLRLKADDIYKLHQNIKYERQQKIHT